MSKVLILLKDDESLEALLQGLKDERFLNRQVEAWSQPPHQDIERVGAPNISKHSKKLYWNRFAEDNEHTFVESAYLRDQMKRWQVPEALAESYEQALDRHYIMAVVDVNEEAMPPLREVLAAVKSLHVSPPFPLSQADSGPIEELRRGLETLWHDAQARLS